MTPSLPVDQAIFLSALRAGTMAGRGRAAQPAPRRLPAGAPGRERADREPGRGAGRRGTGNQRPLPVQLPAERRHLPARRHDHGAGRLRQSRGGLPAPPRWAWRSAARPEPPHSPGSRARAPGPGPCSLGTRCSPADSDTDGVSIAADAIGLNGGTIEDADDDTTDAVPDARRGGGRRGPPGGWQPLRRAGGERRLVRRLAGERRHLPARRDDRGEGRVRPVPWRIPADPSPRWRSRSGAKPGWRTLTTVAARAAA